MDIPSTDSVRPSAALPSSIQAHKVPEHLRMGFLPRTFGRSHMLAGEFAVYDWMRRLCSTYHGGFWHYFDLSNGGFYLALEPGAGTSSDAKLHMRVHCGNDFEGDLSYDAAGIVATLFATNQLVWSGAAHLEDAYYHLREFALTHAEAHLILAAID